MRARKLTREQAIAVTLELDRLVDEYGSQVALTDPLKASQYIISRGQNGRPSEPLARNVCAFQKTTLDALVNKWRKDVDAKLLQKPPKRKTSKGGTLPFTQEQRKRKMVGFTLSDESRTALEKLEEILKDSRSGIVEDAIMATYARVTGAKK